MCVCVCVCVCVREVNAMTRTRNPERVGGQGGPENSQNIGFLSNTGRDPLKNHKATQPVFNV